MSTRQNALNAYRHCIRAINTVFQGDVKVLAGAKAKLRSEMQQSKSKEHPTMNVDQRITLLNQISKYLTCNLVQGVKNPGTDRYMLRFRKETELGKNSDIKKPRSTLTAGEVQAHGCCCGEESKAANTQKQ